MTGLVAGIGLKVIAGNVLGGAGSLLKGLWGALGAFFRALNVQGVIGLGASALLAFLWLHAASDDRHWHKQSDRFQKLYAAEQDVQLKTIANYEEAARKAKEEDAANAARVQAEQGAISERTANSYEDRISAARDQYERLQREASAHSGSATTASVPGLPIATGGTAEASENELLATEQAIQLDELIKWVEQQHAIDPNGKPDAR